MGLRLMVSSFLGGAAISSAVGVYFLRKSIYESSGDLNATILDLKKDVEVTNKDLNARVARLEEQASSPGSVCQHRDDHASCDIEPAGERGKVTASWITLNSGVSR